MHWDVFIVRQKQRRHYWFSDSNKIRYSHARLAALCNYVMLFNISFWSRGGLYLKHTWDLHLTICHLLNRSLRCYFNGLCKWDYFMRRPSLGAARAAPVKIAPTDGSAPCGRFAQ